MSEARSPSGPDRRRTGSVSCHERGPDASASGPFSVSRPGAVARLARSLSRVARPAAGTVSKVTSAPLPGQPVDSSTDDPAFAFLANVDVLRAAVRRARSDDLGGIFERLVLDVGRPEASRLWLLVFSESDASET